MERISRKNSINYKKVHEELSQAKNKLKTKSFVSKIEKEQFERIAENIPRLEHVISTEPPHPELPPKSELIKITGTLDDFCSSRVLEYFEDSEYDPLAFAKHEDREQFGALLLAMLGNVAGSAVTSQKKVRLSSPAEYVQGAINGVPFSGWLGMTRFKKGDYVEMIVALKDDRYIVYAITDPYLKVISTTPQCYLGVMAYKKQVVKSIHFFVLICFLFVFIPFLSISLYQKYAIAISTILYLALIYMFIDFSLLLIGKYHLSKKISPSVLLSEMIFTKLGLKFPMNINLAKITKKKLKEINDYQTDRNDADGRPLPGKNCDSEYFYYY